MSEKNLIEFYKCLLSDKYTQVKSYAHGLIDYLAVPVSVKAHFQR